MAQFSNVTGVITHGPNTVLECATEIPPHGSTGALGMPPMSHSAHVPSGRRRTVGLWANGAMITSANSNGPIGPVLLTLRTISDLVPYSLSVEYLGHEQVSLPVLAEHGVPAPARLRGVVVSLQDGRRGKRQRVARGRACPGHVAHTRSVGTVPVETAVHRTCARPRRRRQR